MPCHVGTTLIDCSPRDTAYWCCPDCIDSSGCCSSQSAKQSTYEAIAARLESGTRALEAQLAVLQIQDFGRLANIMHRPDIITALGNAAR